MASPIARSCGPDFVSGNATQLPSGSIQSPRIPRTSMRRKPVSSSARMAARPMGCAPSRSICVMIFPRCRISPALSRRLSVTDAITRTPLAGLSPMILDKEQVRSSIARRLGMDIGALAPVDRDVEGVVEMMLDATQNYQEPLISERLFAWHAALFPTGRIGMAKITVGAWRIEASGPIGRERVHYEAPAAGRLQGEMTSFIGCFNRDVPIDPVLKAAVASTRHSMPPSLRRSPPKPPNSNLSASPTGNCTI